MKFLKYTDEGRLSAELLRITVTNSRMNPGFLSKLTSIASARYLTVQYSAYITCAPSSKRGHYMIQGIGELGKVRLYLAFGYPDWEIECFEYTVRTHSWSFPKIFFGICCGILLLKYNHVS
jgi:hypothetical protein